MKKPQLERYKHIDEILYLNQEGISTKDLLSEVNRWSRADGCAEISLRQLQYDLRDMKNILGAPLDIRPGQRKIKYNQANYWMFSKINDLKEIDTEDVNNGRIDWLRMQLYLLNESFFKDKFYEVVDYGDNLKLTNIDMLPRILKAIMKERVIGFQYARKFSDIQECKTVHPYFLHQYNSRWYLFGLDDKLKKDNDGIHCYALDRITSCQERSEITYKSIKEEELKQFKNDYFSNIVGVMNDRDVQIEDLKLVFNFGSDNTAAEKDVRLFYNLLKSNSFYDGFTFNEETSKGIATANIKPNPELENHLMMFAHTCYIGNDNIRNSVIKRAQQILNTQNQPKTV